MRTTSHPEFIAQEALAPMAAREAAPLIEAAIRETAAAGVDPDGKAWPAKRDGSRARTSSMEPSRSSLAFRHGSAPHSAE